MSKVVNKIEESFSDMKILFAGAENLSKLRGEMSVSTDEKRCHKVK